MDCDNYDYSNDWSNNTGISDDELLYREMNPDDDWYMGADVSTYETTPQKQPPQQINIGTFSAANIPPNVKIIQSDPNKQGNWFG